MLDDLAQGAGAPSAMENLLAALRDRLRQQGPLERLGLSGRPFADGCRQDLPTPESSTQRALSELATPRGRALAKEASRTSKRRSSNCADPKERFILKRAADLGVDPAKDENRSYLSTLYYRDEAQAAFDAGRMSEALSLFDHLLELQPDNADAVWQRASPVPQRPPAHAGSAQRPSAAPAPGPTKWSRSAASRPYTSSSDGATRRNRWCALRSRSPRTTQSPSDSSMSSRVKSPPARRRPAGNPTCRASSQTSKATRDQAEKQRKRVKKRSKTKAQGANHHQTLGFAKVAVVLCARFRRALPDGAPDPGLMLSTGRPRTSFSRTPIRIFETYRPKNSPGRSARRAFIP